MRLVAGIILISYGIGKFCANQPVGPAILDAIAIGDGVLLIAGLWTPVASSLVVVFAVGNLFIQHMDPSASILLATMGAALALVGPGAWSVDAWLFGWKRIDIRR
jgi:putative oxidoreductase